MSRSRYDCYGKYGCSEDCEICYDWKDCRNKRERLKEDALEELKKRRDVPEEVRFYEKTCYPNYNAEKRCMICPCKEECYKEKNKELLS